MGGLRGSAPGPGQYDTRGNMDIENGHIFGTSVRKDVRDLMGVPGPGQYNAFSGLNNGGASMKAKTSYGGFIQVKDTPGPGQYNPDSRKG